MNRKSSYKVRTIKEMHLWLETEITLMHIGFYILLGILLGSLVAWIIIGLLIAVSVWFAARKMYALLESNKKKVGINGKIINTPRRHR